MRNQLLHRECTVLLMELPGLSFHCDMTSFAKVCGGVARLILSDVLTLRRKKRAGVY